MSIPEQTFSHYPSWPLPLKEVQNLTITPRSTCGYLPHRLSTFRAFEADQLSGDEFQRLMDAGFRRSGTMIYQPMCQACRSCVPIRVPVKDFKPTKSQRRIIKRNKQISVTVQSPLPTQEKWDLYQLYQHKWHSKQLGNTEEDLPSFVSFLYQSPVPSLEFEYRNFAGKLVGVGICDLSSTSLSSVYFYFDPRESRRSLGTFSAVYEIEYALKNGLKYWYAGYWIKNCESMSYKSRFQPAETLGTDGIWRPMPDSA